MKKIKKEFKNPPSIYRSAPFWSWNCKLDPTELCRQIEIFKKMGFGGFYMHPRDGLDTEYLSEEFMDAVKKCADKAEKEDIYVFSPHYFQKLPDRGRTYLELLYM